MLESLEGRDTLVAYGAGTAAEERVDEAAQREAGLVLAATRVGARFWGRLNMAEFLGLGAILVVGWLLVASGSATVGAATAAALLFLQLFGPIGTVLASFDDLQRAAASLARLAGVLDEPVQTSEIVRDGTSGREETRGTEPGGTALEVASAAFAYDGAEVVRDVSFTIAHGGHLAIVGASGAGKSTLAALLTGDLVPSRGTVRFGSSRAETADPHRSAPRIGLVTQETYVFTGTLRDDLRMARPEASDDDLFAALDTVGAGTWVRGLEQGLDTPVGAIGETLPDAHRQQISLARVELLAPDLVILDEATSEDGTSRAVQLGAAATALAARHTTVTIAHRLDQAAVADLILVMEDGQVTERGTHDELLAGRGVYRGLWEAWHHPSAM